MESKGVGPSGHTCLSREMVLENDGDQGRSIFNCNDAVQDPARQKQHFPRAQPVALTFGTDLYLPFDALNGDLSCDAMRRK